MIDTEGLKSKILSLAVSGKLVPQLKEEGTAEELFFEIIQRRESLISKGRIKNVKEQKDGQIEDVPYEIPESWKWVKWGEIVNVVSARRVHQSDWQEQGVPFYRAREIAKLSDEGTVKNDLFISEELFEEFTKLGVPVSGDLMVSAVGTLGKAYVVKDEDRFYYKDASVLCFENYAHLIPEYIKFVMDSELMKNQIRSNSGGTTVDTLTMVRMVQYYFPLPPLKEQRRIAETVNELLEIIDIINSLQDQYQSDATILKNKIIDIGIQGKLTEQLPEDGTAEDLFAEIQAEKAKLIQEKRIKKEKALEVITEDEIPFDVPDNWKWVRLGDICSKISSGNTPTGGSKGGAYVTEGYCFFREQNIYNDGIHNDGMVYITEELLKTRPSSTVLPKDILLNITGGSIGRCALIPDDFSRGSINQHILIIRVVDPRIRFYVHKCLCSPYYQKLIKGNVVGDKDGFSAGRCKNTLIPLPPLSEQDRIVGKIDELLTLV